MTKELSRKEQKYVHRITTRVTLPCIIAYRGHVRNHLPEDYNNRHFEEADTEDRSPEGHGRRILSPEEASRLLTKTQDAKLYV